MARKRRPEAKPEQPALRLLTDGEARWLVRDYFRAQAERMAPDAAPAPAVAFEGFGYAGPERAVTGAAEGFAVWLSLSRPPTRLCAIELHDYEDRLWAARVDDPGAWAACLSICLHYGMFLRHAPCEEGAWIGHAHGVDWRRAREVLGTCRAWASGTRGGPLSEGYMRCVYEALARLETWGFPPAGTADRKRRRASGGGGTTGAEIVAAALADGDTHGRRPAARTVAGYWHEQCLPYRTAGRIETFYDYADWFDVTLTDRAARVAMDALAACGMERVRARETVEHVADLAPLWWRGFDGERMSDPTGADLGTPARAVYEGARALQWLGVPADEGYKVFALTRTAFAEPPAAEVALMRRDWDAECARRGKAGYLADRPPAIPELCAPQWAEAEARRDGAPLDAPEPEAAGPPPWPRHDPDRLPDRAPDDHDWPPRDAAVNPYLEPDADPYPGATPEPSP